MDESSSGFADSGESDSSGGNSDGSEIFDVGGDGDGTADDGGPEDGCQGIDFLFVVDSSGSMQNNQANLISSFPGFIDAIQTTLPTDDYHVLVVDSDLNAAHWCEADNCQSQYAALHGCGVYTCGAIYQQGECATELGAGVIHPVGGHASNQDCGLSEDKRYIDSNDAQLQSTFECVAKVGASGEENEQVMRSMVEAVTAQAQPGGCNDGFLRDDAILVVTILSDARPAFALEQTEDDPSDWYGALVDAKGGNESAIVMIGLLADANLPNGECTLESAPVYQEFVDMFGERGFAGSARSADYSPIFAEAVATIDQTCEDFVPEG